MNCPYCAAQVTTRKRTKKTNSVTQPSSAHTVAVPSTNELARPLTLLNFLRMCPACGLWRLRYKLSLRDVAEMF